MRQQIDSLQESMKTNKSEVMSISHLSQSSGYFKSLHIWSSLIIYHSSNYTFLNISICGSCHLSRLMKHSSPPDCPPHSISYLTLLVSTGWRPTVFGSFTGLRSDSFYIRELILFCIVGKIVWHKRPLLFKIILLSRVHLIVSIFVRLFYVFIGRGDTILAAFRDVLLGSVVVFIGKQQIKVYLRVIYGVSTDNLIQMIPFPHDLIILSHMGNHSFLEKSLKSLYDFPFVHYYFIFIILKILK